MTWIPAAAAGAFAAMFCGLWWRGMRGFLLDIPNERSLHARPTPTGGGVGIVAALVLVALFATDTPLLALHLLLPTLLLCLTGLVDDLRGLPVGTRLLVQTACAGWVMAVSAGAPHTLVTSLLATFCLVGFTNAFNFMDGIDGLAATQAAFVGLGGAALLEQTGGPGHLVLLLAVAGASAAGFLVWNWPPARLFMGDAGSLPLGFLLGTLALLSGNDGALPAWCWVILWAPFLCDTGITLVVRAAARKPLFRAHREHAYQRLAVRGHRRVTTGLLIADVMWLLPLAWIASRYPAHAPVAALTATLPFALLTGAVAWRGAPAGAAAA